MIFVREPEKFRREGEGPPPNRFIWYYENHAAAAATAAAAADDDDDPQLLGLPRFTQGVAAWRSLNFLRV
jgi:hypothetical protein